MAKFRTILAAFIATLVLLIGGGGDSALAWLHFGSTTQYPPEGGTWTYGFWDTMVRSRYYLSSGSHGSTAQFWDGSSWHTARSLCTSPGYTSVAELGGYNLWYTDDAYYYRTPC